MLYNSQNPHGGDIYEKNIELDFSANTNPFGTPKGVLDAVSSAMDGVEHYPDPYCRRLVSAIAEFEQLPPEYILCGNGAAELIYSYCAALKPKTALELAPTFSEYSLALEKVGCRIERYYLSSDNNFLPDAGILAFIESKSPDVLFLCNPNNPSGQPVPGKIMQSILSLCIRKNIRLFMDECFLDLCDGGESLKKYLDAMPGLFILKAFTKSYGMAGLRLGYGLCADKALLSAMASAVQPWNVSALAQAAGVAALQEQEFLAKTRALIPTERKWLSAELEKLDFQVCPSMVNFILFKAPSGLDVKLIAKGIAIRNCANYHGLGPGWYRIAVRQHEDNLKLIKAMKE